MNTTTGTTCRSLAFARLMQYWPACELEDSSSGIKKIFPMKNIITLLVSAYFAPYTWMMIARNIYDEDALLVAIFGFGLRTQGARVWFGAFGFLDKRTD
jgi:hypothetical protein